MNQESHTEQPAQNQQQATVPENITKISDLQRMNIDQLQAFARSIGLKHTAPLPRSGVVFEVVKTLSDRPGEVLVGEGVLEVLPDGFGFLRSPFYNFVPSAEDIYVSPAQIRRFDLRKGDTLFGTIRSPKEKEKYFAMLKVERINDKTFEQTRDRVLFENLTPLYPNKRLVMETSRDKLPMRILDLAAPIGKGQRGLIVAPPKSGENHPSSTDRQCHRDQQS